MTQRLELPELAALSCSTKGLHALAYHSDVAWQKAAGRQLANPPSLENLTREAIQGESSQASKQPTSFKVRPLI